MKLIRLKLDCDFKSLKEGFTLDFRKVNDPGLGKFQPFCFAGLNGSGKSNVLEALASIFYHLELCANRFKPESFREIFDPAHNPNGPDAFEVEYLLLGGDEHMRKSFGREIIVSIKKEIKKQPSLMVKENGSKTNYVEFPVVADNYEKSAIGKILLPNLVVGYSSGENEILSHPFLKTRLIHFDEYMEASLEGYADYVEPESSLLYIDPDMSQAVLLVNMIFQNEEAIKPLKEAIGIETVQSFRITLNNHLLSDSNRRNPSSKKALELLDQRIEKLKLCATGYHQFERHTEYETLYLDFYLDEGCKRAFKHHFKDAFDLFRLFQILYTLNYNQVPKKIKKTIYTYEGVYLDGKLPATGKEGKVFHYENYLIKKKGIKTLLLLKELSDGEHQFIHSLGICLMLEKKRCLMLLDEPDTHFNPDWRSKFIQVLNESIEASGGNNLLKDVLLTSHSPFIISDCLPNNVIVFKKKNGKLIVKNAKQLDFNTYGTSVEIILQELFDRDQSIGDHTNQVFEDIDFESIKTREDVIATKKLFKNFGESIEKDLVLARLNQLLPPSDEPPVGNLNNPVITPSDGDFVIPAFGIEDDDEIAPQSYEELT